MLEPDELLRKLAFQRAVLSLMKESGPVGPDIEKAIENVEFLIENLSVTSSNR